ncbi:hypothetical protein CH249_14350 [Rhodococcus sp. 05-2255-3B1]|uniref:hypothetical protein n=1 Tax=unclassified Rhodococcus (in: high G+C Gram-positive bacteria) TaxID=192944 RepID=UPI000B9C3847|nr:MULTISPECIES: hypothetical protein [unclassified Rhodococcus (in: high G+C Gram-positive bacteria)]OZE10081.1 hypothetical protein CH249_14350 [Rhodococcus sp. 05-2255-3B1]OZE10258.1 hypothetical protein CH250_13270 [Rhodococcus sp. 05-2255-3C]OZE24385.1 hypothetical protein CH255_01925 [Rhodococcus sp. 05-2255-2A2]
MQEEFTSYYVTIATVTGALFAVLFVALQVGFERWRTTALRTYSAFFTLAELAAPLFVSLIALLPNVDKWWLGARIVGVLGLCFVVAFIVLFVSAAWRRLPLDYLDKWQIVGSTLLSGSAFAVWVWKSFAGDDGRAWVAALCVWLAMSGITEAWLILIGSRPQPDSSPQKPELVWQANGSALPLGAGEHSLIYVSAIPRSQWRRPDL